MPSLQKLMDSGNTIPSGVVELDAAIGGGFHEGGVYDLNYVPGSVGKWELLFSIVVHSIELHRRHRKVLVVSTGNKVPWHKLRRRGDFRREYADNVATISVGSAGELAALLESYPFSDVSAVLIDGFHELWDPLRTRPPVSSVSSGVKGGAKKKNSGQVSTITSSIRSLQEVSMHLSELAARHRLIFCTTGSVTLYHQPVRRAREPHEDGDESGSDRDGDRDQNMGFDDPSEKRDYMKVLVPRLRLTVPLSDLYTDRIILYNDWIEGLDRTKSFNMHQRLLSDGKLTWGPHFLVPQVPFVTGFFRVADDFTIEGDQFTAPVYETLQEDAASTGEGFGTTKTMRPGDEDDDDNDGGWGSGGRKDAAADSTASSPTSLHSGEIPDSQ